MSISKDKSFLNLIAEAGMLKRVSRSGWWVLGIKAPESVADHSFRCTMIGYVLSQMESYNPSKVMLMCMFNDMPEARLNDQHKMAQRYFDSAKAEDKAFTEQVSALDKNTKDELSLMHLEYRKQKTKASIIARDADILECLIQAKEYYEHGFSQAPRFMKKAPNFLKTKSAKRLWLLAKKSSLNSWWENLSDFKR